VICIFILFNSLCVFVYNLSALMRVNVLVYYWCF